MKNRAFPYSSPDKIASGFRYDGCHDILDAAIFQGIEHDIAVTAGFQYSPGFQYTELLRGKRLFGSQRLDQLSHGTLAVHENIDNL